MGKIKKYGQPQTLKRTAITLRNYLHKKDYLKRNFFGYSPMLISHKVLYWYKYKNHVANRYLSPT